MIRLWHAHFEVSSGVCLRISGQVLGAFGSPPSRACASVSGCLLCSVPSVRDLRLSVPGGACAQQACVIGAPSGCAHSFARLRV
ncbi:hypothetical protein AVEN_98080-1 [Araneus ventricosus]|uniref:Uncharacterized protein n=1 Tax=Araneus ventricosus TaxID=182803 RepID=A0A4Y2VFZ9_ARAVE|nr:hypothetical protein AVEN_98080-1 [Araneus ventricosus]